MIRPLPLATLLLMLLPLTALGQGTINVQPSDNPLKIQGWIGDENSFIGNIGVTLTNAPNANPVKLNINKTDLKNGAGTETIGRQLVAVTGDQMLTPDVTSTYQVKVTGVKEPGEYSGQIQFLLAGQKPDAAVVVAVNLVANVRPSLSLLTENDRLQGNLVNCSRCWLARLLISSAAIQGRNALDLEKPLGAPLVFNDVKVVVKGDQTRFQLADDHLKVLVDQVQPAGPLTDKKQLKVPVIIAAHNIPPDHYTGSIYLRVAGQATALKVPVDFNVRSGPLWPLFVLLISILIGRLFKFMQDKGNAIADALQSINRLEFRLRNLVQGDVEIIQPMLNAARDLVHQEKAAEAVTAVNAIAARMSTLGELRQIEARLTGKEQNPAVPPILADIRQARENLSLGRDNEAKALLPRIKDAIAALAAAAQAGFADAEDLSDVVARVDAASTAAGVLGTAREKSDRLRSSLVMLSGLSDQFRAEATLFLARPILWLALLLGLLALGLKTLYVDNPIFGVNPFTDFLGLMFWGLSADIASRTLSGLQLPKARP